MTVGAQVAEALTVHQGLSRRAADAKALGVLDEVKIPSAAARFHDYPHQFSGGMRQRIAIAIALVCEPRVLIADEPTTALDVTVQAGVLRLLRRLCDERGLAVLLVTHDLGVMSAIADEVSVMRHGLVVENGPRGQVFTEPRHEYTRVLLDALPERNTR
jgi:ABC-type dipeptide/oligopeptide/nickel transport system ATPase component